MQFSQQTIDSLDHYVYRLIDPRNGQTFYTGKGVGNRVFDHIEEISIDIDSTSSKHIYLRELSSAGFAPKYVIHRHGMDANTAFEVEAALIDAYTDLTNQQSGHHNSDRGARTVEEIMRQYELPEIPVPVDSLLVINVNNIQNRTDRVAIYNQVKGHWVISVKNAVKMKYILAAYKGIAIGVFLADRWYPSPDHPRRFCFEGTEASEKVWDYYVGEYGKRIVHEGLKNGQNPIKYYRP